MSGRALLGAYLASKNSKGGKTYVVEDYAPFDSNEIGAMQFGNEWVATTCQPMWYGAPEVYTETVAWMDDLSDWATTLQ